MKKFNKALKKAGDFYSRGEWEKAREILIQIPAQNLNKKQLSKLKRLLGWISYYLGKKKVENPEYAGNYALDCFQKVIDLRVLGEDVDSARAGIPLVLLYLLGISDEAIEAAKRAVDEASDLTARAAALNTLGCVLRDTGKIVEALETFREGMKLAQKIDAYRVLGHILANEAGALTRLIPYMKLQATREALKNEVMVILRQALDLYQQAEEETGQSTEFHRKEVVKKLGEIEKL